jgi:uncharacterized membrane protein YfcA
MMTLDPILVASLVTLVTVAAVINGMLGFGFALLAVIALAIAVGAKDGVIVMSLLAPVVSGLQLIHHRAHAPLWRRLFGLIAGALVGTVVGAQLLVILPAAVISLALGLFTIWYVADAARAIRPALAARTEERMAPLAGLVGGISNGTLGASGPVFGTYLSAIGLRGAAFGFAISLVFFTMSLLRLTVLTAFGMYTLPLLVLAALLIVPSIVGQRLGFWLQDRAPAAMLHRGVLIVLAVAGASLAWRGIDALILSPGA